MTHDIALVEAMEAARQMGWFNRGNHIEAMTAALTALCAARPDVAAVLKGEAVAVPAAGPTPEMRRVTWEAQYRHTNFVRGLGHDDETIAGVTEQKVTNDEQAAQDHVAYAAMLSASPYAREPGQ